MHRTYFRTFTTTAAMVLVSFLLIGAAFGFASRQVFVSEARESMMTNSREISRMAVAYAAEGDLRSLELRMTLSTIGASTNQHIFIVNPSGYIITCSDSAVFCEHIGKRLDESVTAILPQSGTVASLGTLGGFYASEHYTVISALTDDGALLGHLFVSKDTVTALSIWETILPLFFFISLIVLCLALIFSYASSKYFAKPLRDMADAARRFGRGELNVRVEPTDSTDEIGELTDTINEMSEKISRAEKMQSEFVSSVSHELRTPLTAISGWSETLLSAGAGVDSAEARRGLSIIQREAARLADMVEELLEFTRLQDGRFTLNVVPCDLRTEFEDTVFMYGSRLRQEGIVLDYLENDDDIPEIPCDPARMKQVFLNILDNAAKHGGEGGRITAEICRENADGQDSVVIRIRDFGPGIPEEELPLVKKKFYKGASKARGSGIGLAVCEEIVTMHNGVLDIANAEGGGAVVTIRLPIAEQ